MPELGLDALFQALADPGRRRMIERLCRGPASVSELGAPLEMTLSAVVQHLQILENSGLVRTQKRGRVRTCRIENKAMERVEHWLRARRASSERHSDRSGDFVVERDAAELPANKSKS